ncbi:HAD family hydrolase [Clostridioides difficile]|uniref:HAD family hydrolase n=1 Tax=Clostridioides difficile TaxID=1496 RepID=UPI003F8CF2D7
MEVMNEGVDKGNAVKILAEKMNIDREDIIAFGDNYNDIEMGDDCRGIWFYR